MDGTILLLDNSEYEREKIKITLDTIGKFKFIEVISIDMYNNLNQDFSDVLLVIIDISFPTERECFDIISSLRKKTSTSNIPIVIISKSDSVEYKSRALKFNVNDFIIKPYQTKRLTNSITSLLNLQNNFRYSLDSANVITMSVEDYISKEFKIAERADQNLSIILITHININSSTESASQPEEVYHMAIEKVKSASRTTDTVILNGDKNILVILPFTNSQGAQIVVNKINTSLVDGLTSLNMPNDFFYTVFATFPLDGENFQAIMQKVLRRVDSKIMLEKISQIGFSKLDHARKTYRRFK